MYWLYFCRFRPPRDSTQEGRRRKWSKSAPPVQLEKSMNHFVFENCHFLERILAKVMFFMIFFSWKIVKEFFFEIQRFNNSSLVLCKQYENFFISNLFVERFCEKFRGICTWIIRKKIWWKDVVFFVYIFAIFGPWYAGVTFNWYRKISLNWLILTDRGYMR